MHRSFQTALTIFNPEIVFILGDIFDEGSWVDHEYFEDYKKRFDKLFHVPESTKLIVVVGNHDIGFHYATHPYLVGRFEKSFNTSGVQLITEKDVHFVTINSIAMEGDKCHLCLDAEHEMKYFSRVLNCYKGNIDCKNVEPLPYSRPIVLQHFPMYRKSDLRCKDADSENLEKYREKWEVLSMDSTDLIGKLLDPRLVIAGHSHHYCRIEKNRLKIEEYTLASFNWRNLNNPSFILAKFSPTEHYIGQCKMTRETTVFLTYFIGGILAVIDSVARFSLFKLLVQKILLLCHSCYSYFRRKYSSHKRF
jgi:hypothetical protein